MCVCVCVFVFVCLSLLPSSLTFLRHLFTCITGLMFTIQPVDGKGLGMIACCDIQKGQ